MALPSNSVGNGVAREESDLIRFSRLLPEPDTQSLEKRETRERKMACRCYGLVFFSLFLGVGIGSLIAWAGMDMTRAPVGTEPGGTPELEDFAESDVGSELAAGFSTDESVATDTDEENEPAEPRRKEERIVGDLALAFGLKSKAKNASPTDLVQEAPGQKETLKVLTELRASMGDGEEDKFSSVAQESDTHTNLFAALTALQSAKEQTPTEGDEGAGQVDISVATRLQLAVFAIAQLEGIRHAKTLLDFVGSPSTDEGKAAVKKLKEAGTTVVELNDEQNSALKAAVEEKAKSPESGEEDDFKAAVEAARAAVTELGKHQEQTRASAREKVLIKAEHRLADAESGVTSLDRKIKSSEIKRASADDDLKIARDATPAAQRTKGEQLYDVVVFPFFGKKAVSYKAQAEFGGQVRQDLVRLLDTHNGLGVEKLEKVHRELTRQMGAGKSVSAEVILDKAAGTTKLQVKMGDVPCTPDAFLEHTCVQEAKETKEPDDPKVPVKKEDDDDTKVPVKKEDDTDDKDGK